MVSWATSVRVSTSLGFTHSRSHDSLNRIARCPQSKARGQPSGHLAPRSAARPVSDRPGRESGGTCCLQANCLRNLRSFSK